MWNQKTNPEKHATHILMELMDIFKSSDDTATMMPTTSNAFFTYLFSLEIENLHKEKNFIKFQHRFRKGNNTFGKANYWLSFSNYCRQVQDLNLHMKRHQRQCIDKSLTISTFQTKTLEKYVWMSPHQYECHCCNQTSTKVRTQNLPQRTPQLNHKNLKHLLHHRNNCKRCYRPDS